MKTILLFVIFMIASNLTAQIESDSTDFGLDSLLERSVKQNDFVRSASKYDQIAYESPNSLSIVNKSTINTFGYEELSEALDNSDVIFINNDLNYQYIGFMGMGKPTDNNNRIQMLFDGHKLNDYVYNAIPIDELALDVHSYEKIEVIKGPGSVLYGEGAMFGVINLIPLKIDKSLVPKFRVRYGSYDTRSISGMWNYKDDNGLEFNLHGYYYKSRGRDYYFPEFDSPETNNGNVSNLDHETKRGLYASVKYKNFELFGISSYRYKEVPTASYDVDFGSLEATTDIYNFLEARYNHQFSFDKEISVRLFYDQYKYSGIYIYDTYPTWDANDSRAIGGELRFLWDILPNDRLILGSELNRAYKVKYDYWDDSTVYSSFSVPVNIYSLFFQNEYHYNNNLTCYLASRLDIFNDSDAKISPRVTLVYTLNESNTIRLLAGTSYRTPAAYEKYYDDPIGGYKKNDKLEPEKTITYALYWNYRITKEIMLDVNVYNNKINSFIDLIVDPNDGLFYYANYLNIKSFGFGIGLKAETKMNLGGYIYYQHQNSEDDRQTKLTVSPDNILKFGISYKFFDYFSAGFEYRFESPKLTEYLTEVPSVYYSGINFYNSKDIYGLKFSLVIKNLFNNNIQSPGYLQNIQRTFPMPGRNYTISINYGL